MNREKQLLLITKLLQGNIHKALTVSGINETMISKAINRFKDVVEANAIKIGIKSLREPCDNFINYYNNHTDDAWLALYNSPIRVPEITILEKKKQELRKLWRQVMKRDY